MILDPGFDQCDDIVSTYYNCPTGSSQCPVWPNFHRWDRYHGGTSDQFNACDVLAGGDFRVPSNLLGYQHPRSQYGYGGFFAYVKDHNVYPEYREYLENHFTQLGGNPMVAREEYCISFYLSLANTSDFAMDQIGVFFAGGNAPAVTWLSADEVITTPASFETPDSLFLSDTLDWMLVTGTYQALGGENTLIIGNFQANSGIDTLRVDNTGNPFPHAYYYVEDVCVSPMSTCSCDGHPPVSNPGDLAAVELPNIITPNGDGLNDIFGDFENMGWDWSLSVYNRWGVPVYHTQDWQSFPFNGENERRQPLSTGVYYYVILTSTGDSRAGSFMLAR